MTWAMKLKTGWTPRYPHPNPRTLRVRFRLAGEAAAQGKPSVMEAPLLGRKEYDDNKEDDRLSIRLVVDSIGVPAHKGILELSRVQVDGETEIAQGYLITAGQV